MNARARIGLFAAAALAAGCSSSSAPPDGGSDAGTTDGGLGFVDGGHKDGGSSGVDGGGDAGSGPAACASDSDCLSVGRRCSPDGGCTLPAAPCDPSQGSSNCSGTSYCWIDGINTTHGCYCDPLPAGLDAGPGVCYVPIPPCGACVNQIDCGPSAQVDAPAYCGPVGPSGTYCLPLDTGGSCPSAFVPGNVDNTDVCVPSCGTCPCTPCSSDADCPTPAAGVCNLQNGACKPPCQVQTDCITGEVCNVLGKYLDPTVGAYYAAGECGPACSSASDCTAYQGSAGLTYYCDLDGGAFCRPTGCIQDGECVGSGLSSTTVRAWCDIWNGNGCTVSGCRLGEDPETSEPYTDCLGGYACFLPDGGTAGQEDGGALVLGSCVATPCNQVPGGGHAVCTAGQFCCGEGDAGTSCGSAAAGQCYAAPSPPWCVSCDPSNGMLSNPACAGVNDGFPGAVACVLARGIGNTTAWCGPACDPNSPWTCPSGWDCTQEGSGYNCITRDGCPDGG